MGTVHIVNKITKKIKFNIGKMSTFFNFILQGIYQGNHIIPDKGGKMSTFVEKHDFAEHMIQGRTEKDEKWKLIVLTC